MSNTERDLGATPKRTKGAKDARIMTSQFVDTGYLALLRPEVLERFLASRRKSKKS